MCGSRTPRRLRFGPFRIISRAVIVCSVRMCDGCCVSPRATQPPEPLRRDGDERGKQHHEKQDDQLGPHERPHGADEVRHRNARDAGDDVEHDADRRRDQPDRIVDDEQNAEIDRIDAGLLDDRHQDRRQDQNGGRHVERGADDHHDHHDGREQQRLVAHEGLEQIDDLSGDLRDRDQPRRHQRRGDQEHDDAGRHRGA